MVESVDARRWTSDVLGLPRSEVTAKARDVPIGALDGGSDAKLERIL